MLSKLLNKTIFILVVIGIISSCKKMDLKPVDRFTDENFWLVNGNVSNALNTCYQRIFNSQRFFFNEALSDNAYAQLDVNVGTPSAIASGNDGLFTSDLARILSDWGFYYNGIYACNLFLENVDQNQSIALNTKNRMKAEARFIRAFHYFRLMNWFGDVPLITNIEPDIDAVKNTARTPKADVLTFVLSELDAAITDLPKKEDYAGADKGRVTKAAAKTLKARVLLYQGTPATYGQVITICEDLMNNQATNGTYNTLQTTYSSVFALNNEQNAEVIFDLTYIGANVRVYDEPSRFIP
ncbi:MAG TPA: RagB/SusD family nutrient uptake outer membrane protein, partial [Flavitalea sp.]|nr:RagB/SusD family nutrient uptake outer membrane protein [Flavitalea sp.]